MDGHALEGIGHIALGHAQRQPFDHRCLAHPGLTRQDGVVLTTTHQDVDGLTDLAIATDHRVHLTIAGALREVGGELIQRRRPATGRQGRLGRIRARQGIPRLSRLQRLSRLSRAPRGLCHLVLELIQLEAGPQGRAAMRHLAQGGLGQQGQHHMHPTDACSVRLQRRDQPRMLQQLGQSLREHRRAGVAHLEATQLHLQIALKPADRHTIALTQHRQIALSIFQQGEQEVLHVHFMMPPSHAQAGCALGRLAGGVIELGDEGFEVLTHDGVLLELMNS